jgi:hypothetical protein
MGHLLWNLIGRRCARIHGSGKSVRCYAPGLPRSGLLEPRPGADCLQRPLRSRFRQPLRPGVSRPEKLGVSCGVKVPVG